jgi:methylated-DNA-[protein]-cysteine S-methyltransferase
MSSAEVTVAEVATVSTPNGPFTVIATGDAVLASGWTADPANLLGLIHPSLRPASLTPRSDLGKITAAVADYYDGDLHAIDPIPVHQLSVGYRAHAWDVLRTVPAGQPISYRAYAELTGSPRAVRAAASACAMNAAALFVPCHRIVRSDGSLGGYRWGLDRKTSLLEHERRLATPEQELTP